MAERFHYMEEVGGSSPTPAYQHSNGRNQSSAATPATS